MLYVNLQIPFAVCQCNFQKFIIDTVRENHTAQKAHYALWRHKYICILFKAKFLKK